MHSEMPVCIIEESICICPGTLISVLILQYYSNMSKYVYNNPFDVYVFSSETNACIC